LCKLINECEQHADESGEPSYYMLITDLKKIYRKLQTEELIKDAEPGNQAATFERITAEIRGAHDIGSADY